MVQQRLDASSFQIGYVCILQREMDAVVATLDERFLGLSVSQNQADENSYMLGRIKSHLVVIVCTPFAGKSPAATTTAWLKATFPNLRVLLLVGIAGGVWSPKRDIRLGDIVVGVNRESAAVIQYDLGRAEQGMGLVPTGILGRPPSGLIQAVKVRQTWDNFADEPAYFDIIKSISQSSTTLFKAMAERPAPETDILYPSTYRHRAIADTDDSCSLCDPREALERPKRERLELPQLHQGIIGSGDQVIKDAAVRDGLAAKHDIICFEMEAAGVNSVMPFLAIRGISDYCDSHKNKYWQDYASIAAAAYAKSLVEMLPHREIDRLPGIQSLSHKLEAMDEREISQRWIDKLEKWLNPADPATKEREVSAKRHPGTGTWLLLDQSYVAWKQEVSTSLWLRGESGSGKSVLVSCVLEDLRKYQGPLRPLLYFFFTEGDPNKQSCTSLLSSLVMQLYRKTPSTVEALRTLYQTCDIQSRKPSDEELYTALEAMLAQVDEATIVIDALDECGDRTNLATYIERWRSSEILRLRLLVTSLPGLDDFDDLAEGYVIPMSKENINCDIADYVLAVLRSNRKFQKRWARRPEVMEKVRAGVVDRAEGMFRWAACSLSELVECKDPVTLNEALQSLPKDLHGIYTRILSKTPEANRDQAIAILQLLTWTDQALNLEQAVDVCATVANPQTGFKPDNRMPVPEELRLICGHLVRFNPDSSGSPIVPGEVELGLAHSSVRRFLTSDNLLAPYHDRINERAAHLALVSLCVRYLSYGQVYMKYHGLRDVIDNRDTVEPDYRLPFARQAASLLVDLLHRLGSNLDNKVQQEVMQFLVSGSACFLYAIDGGDYCVYMVPKEDYLPEARLIALYWASAHGLYYLAQKLLKDGVDPRPVCTMRVYRSPLQVSILRNHPHVVRLLLENKSAVNRLAETSFGGNKFGTPIYMACRDGYLDIVHNLLEYGADPTIGNESAGWPLTRAIYGGYTEIVKVVLDAGFDTMQGVDVPAGALRKEQSQSEWVEILVKHGVPLLADDCITIVRNGFTALYGIVEERLTPELANEVSEDKTLLFWAAMRGLDNIGKRCIDLGADVNALDSYLDVPLHYAANSGHLSTVKLLVEAGTGLGYVDVWGTTPKQCANGEGPSVRRRQPDCVAYLEAAEKYDFLRTSGDLEGFKQAVDNHLRSLVFR
ncbi:Ankyrin repeat-containing protein 43 [Elsinoe fawcettii]|nr:Ankyrin repeat-containing protein 43 [Elsinoe fawcettii]